MRTNYVLIDFENVQPESLALLDQEHFRVLLFVGEKQTRMPVALVRSLQPFGKRAEYIVISGSGRNALDFHIAYYIGKLAAEDSQSYFHIVSGDAGFDPLIAHLKKARISVTRVASVADIPIVKQATATSIADRIKLIVARLHQLKQAPPRSMKTLRSTISALFKDPLSAEEIDKLIKELQRRKCVSLEGKRVLYDLPPQ